MDQRWHTLREMCSYINCVYK